MDDSYLTVFLKNLRAEIQEVLDSELNNGIKVGLWVFLYDSNTENLQTLEFISKKNKSLKEIKDKSLSESIKNAKIPKGFGTIGYTIESKENQFVNNTFLDPRGVVLSQDEKIGQKYAYLHIQFHSNNGNRPLVIYDVFFNDDAINGEVLKKDLNDFFESEEKKESLLYIQEYLETSKHEKQIERYDDTYDVPRDDDPRDIQEKINEAQVNFRKNVFENLLYYYKLYAVEFCDKISNNVITFCNRALFSYHLKLKFDWCSIQTKICSHCPFKDIFQGEINSFQEEDCFFHKLNEIFCIKAIEHNGLFHIGLYKDIISSELEEEIKNGIKTVYEHIKNEIIAYDKSAHNINELILNRKKINDKLNDGILDNLINISSTNPELILSIIVFSLENNTYIFDRKNTKKIPIYYKFPSSYLPVQFACKKLNTCRKLNNGDDIKDYFENYPPTFKAYNSEIVLEKNNSIFVLKNNGVELKLKLGEKDFIFSKIIINESDYFDKFINNFLNSVSWAPKKNKKKLESILDVENNIKSENIKLSEGDDKTQIIMIENLEIALYPNKEVSVDKQFVNKLVRFKDLRKSEYELKLNLYGSVIRSSIAAIMSRNMSHNLGSNVLADIVSTSDYVSPEDLNSLNRYLQNRMDFIAQITTDFPEWSFPAYFNKELMHGFFSNYILIDRIGISEELRAYQWPKSWLDESLRGKLIIRTGLGCNGKNFRWTINEFELKKEDETDPNDIQLSIPGGIIGYHAFYTIIENIIRNSAKHGYASRRNNNLYPNNKYIYNIKENRNSTENKKLLVSYSPDNEITEEDFSSFDSNNLTALLIEKRCIKEYKNGKPVITNKEGDIINLVNINNNNIFIYCEDENDIKAETSEGIHFLALKEFEEFQNKDSYESKIQYLYKSPLRINIRIDDISDKDYVWVTIWDDLPHKFSQPKIENQLSGEIKEKELKNRTKEAGIETFGYLNDRLRQSFITESGELKKENWGMAEQKICAGFLQNRSLPEIGASGGHIIDYGNDCFDINNDEYLFGDSHGNKYPKMIIKSIPVNRFGEEISNNGNKTYYIGTRFWMKKPKIAALIN